MEECPVCKKSIQPVHLNSIINRTGDGLYFLESHLLCKGCNTSFIAHYKVSSPDNNMKCFGDGPLFVAPNQHCPTKFEDNILTLSPAFVKIYNQAQAAETSGLDEIAGLGFRKSLEFLIKDFAIKEFPDDDDSIRSMNLSSCIKKYIDDSRIKTLAEKSAWIGNDEAHYIRKQEDRDISDMKNFIKAAVYFISMILITQDADSMIPK